MNWRKWSAMALSAALIVVLCSRLNWIDIFHIIERANVAYLVPFVVIELADRVFMAWKWRLLLLREFPGYPLGRAIKIYLMSNATGLLLPIGGVGPDLVRVGWLKIQGVPSDAAISSILVERLTGLLGTLLMVTMAFFMLLHEVALKDDHVFKVILACSIAGTVVGMVLILSARARQLLGAETWMAALFTRVGLGRHWHAVLRYARRPGLLSASVGLSWIEQFAEVASFYACCLALHIPITFGEAAMIIPIAAVLARLPISFMGIGVREASIVYLGGLFGISYTDAMTASMASLTLFLLLLLPIILWSTFYREEIGIAAEGEGKDAASKEPAVVS